MTMHGAFHPKSDADKLYLTREKGGCGLISCEGCVQSEENNLGWYVRNSMESLIRGFRFAKVVDTEDVVSKDEFKRGWMNEKEQRWKEKRMYGQFVREMPESTDKNKTWEWLRKADRKI